MSDIKMTNIPSMNVGKMVEKLSSAYCTIIQSNYACQELLHIRGVLAAY